MDVYYRPIVQTDHARSNHALTVAGGRFWFDQVEVLERHRPPQLVPVQDVPRTVLAQITTPRAPVAGLDMAWPRLMGILNATPDSFSDGGAFVGVQGAITRAKDMIRQGVDILDIGGESTRPGADPVPVEDEIKRVEPVIAALAQTENIPISVDTRKAAVAQATLAAGAQIINDVSGLQYDAALASVTAHAKVPICLMHSPVDPKTMQDAPHYDHVLLDVYDHLAEQITVAEQAGIGRHNIIVDPGIGFGKTDAHNLALMRGLSLFHGLGCPILLGVSRKSLIGRIGDEPDPMARLPGSVALALAGLAQGVQITRVHDIAETKQAFGLWLAATGIGQRR